MGGKEVWTDGGGKHPGGPLGRRCSWGAASENGQGTMSGLLPGPVQTVGRAELMAAVMALEKGAAMVVSDNQGVVKGTNNIALGFVRSVKPSRVNADLWKHVLGLA